MIGQKLGFDYNYYTTVQVNTLWPQFEQKVVKVLPDGSRHVLNEDGAIVLQKDDARGIPKEIDHLLKDREGWEKEFKPRLQWSDERIDRKRLEQIAADNDRREYPLGLYCGSLFGRIRNWLGLLGVSYLYADDEELYDEIIDTLGELQYRIVEALVNSGIRFDFAHFWEDIAGRDGPLVVPGVFYEKVGPKYKRITDLLHEHGIFIVSVDCDGDPIKLIPTWLDNGVNTMFPIEYGAWKGDFKRMRDRFGTDLRGVGGMNKIVFAKEYADVDREIERLAALVKLGGYIPCPDHRIPPDAKWENVVYYTSRMREVFG